MTQRRKSSSVFKAQVVLEMITDKNSTALAIRENGIMELVSLLLNAERNTINAWVPRWTVLVPRVVIPQLNRCQSVEGNLV